MPEDGLEPSCCHQRRILNPLRLPISPPGQEGIGARRDYNKGAGEVNQIGGGVWLLLNSCTVVARGGVSAGFAIPFAACFSRLLLRSHLPWDFRVDEIIRF